MFEDSLFCLLFFFFWKIFYCGINFLIVGSKILCGIIISYLWLIIFVENFNVIYVWLLFSFCRFLKGNVLCFGKKVFCLVGIRNWFFVFVVEKMCWFVMVFFFVLKEFYFLVKRKGDKFECFDKMKLCDIWIIVVFWLKFVCL